MNVALPSVQRGLHFSPANLQWVVNAYTLIFGGFLLLGGRAADLLGRRRLFVVGVALFAVASLLNGVAQSSTMLIFGRGLQGLGGALVSPAALSIIMTTFQDNGERTRALGVWSAIAAGGAAFGLLLGGVLTDLISWRWNFFVNVPVGIATVMLALRYVPESRADLGHRRFDAVGATTVTAGLLAIVFGIVKAQSLGLGLRQDHRRARSRRNPAGRLRGPRIPLRGSAREALDLPDPVDRDRQRGDDARRLGVVRNVLLRLSLRAGRAPLQPAEGRIRLPAAVTGDRRSAPASRRRSSPGSASATSPCSG